MFVVNNSYLIELKAYLKSVGGKLYAVLKPNQILGLVR